MQTQEFKVTLMGHTQTGKTTFVANLLHGEFRGARPTLGVDVTVFTFHCRDRKYRINFWDCAGNPRYSGLGPNKYAIGSDMVLIFTDPNRDDNDVFLECVPSGTPYHHVSQGTRTEDVLVVIKSTLLSAVGSDSQP